MKLRVGVDHGQRLGSVAGLTGPRQREGILSSQLTTRLHGRAVEFRKHVTRGRWGSYKRFEVHRRSSQRGRRQFQNGWRRLVENTSRRIVDFGLVAFHLCNRRVSKSETVARNSQIRKIIYERVRKNNPKQ